jgi:hypothetical protein
VTQHLTSQQISEWMAGPRSAEYERHVQECGDCARAIASLEETLAQFGEAYRDWGGSQMVPARIAATEAKLHRRGPAKWLRVSMAAAALIALAVIPADRYHRHRAAQMSAEDDALLQEIHAEVSQSVPSSFSALADLTAAGTGKGIAQ